VLVPGPDWVAVDLASGALVRSPAVPADDHVAPSAGGAEAGTETKAPPLLGRPLSAVELVIGSDPDPADPGRPEAVTLDGQPTPLGEPRRRATRRLLRHLVTRATDQPLLGTLGPSICYADLEGSRGSGPWCQFMLAGRRHTLPCTPQAVPDPSATGHGAKLLVVALGAPRLGQVAKVVLGTLPQGRR
jgi:hypothetical protein